MTNCNSGCGKEPVGLMSARNERRLSEEKPADCVASPVSPKAEGSRDASKTLEAILPLVYDELREFAARNTQFPSVKQISQALLRHTMSLEIVRDIYRRFSDGDLEGFLALCAPDIEWVVNGPSELEKCRAFSGVDGVREFLEILNQTWHFTSFKPREFINGGDRIVVLGEETGTDRRSGEVFENRWAHVFTIRNRVVVTFREFLCHWPEGLHPPLMSGQS